MPGIDVGLGGGAQGGAAVVEPGQECQGDQDAAAGPPGGGHGEGAAAAGAAPGAAQHVPGRVGAHESGVLRGAAASATRLLDSLTDHNLVIQHALDRYCLHDLIRLHARAMAGCDPAPDRDAALDRLLDYYQHTASRANALVTPFPHPVSAGPAPAYAPVLPDPDAAWAWLRAERPNLLAAVAHASDHAQPRLAIALTADLAPMLHADGPGSQEIALQTAAAMTAESLGDQRSLACALTELAHARRTYDEFHEFEQALEIYRSLGDPSGEAYALVRLADARRLAGDFPGAADDLEHALRLYQDLGERRGQAHALARLGDARRQTGDYPGALGDLEHAPVTFRMRPASSKPRLTSSASSVHART